MDAALQFYLTRSAIRTELTTIARHSISRIRVLPLTHGAPRLRGSPLGTVGIVPPPPFSLSTL